MAGLEGTSFGDFEILEKLGQGGMGAVYKARQGMLNRLTALKVMSGQLGMDETFVKRFIREAAAAANLSHPNMVQVYKCGEVDGIHYIAMEYVEGESLRKRLDRVGKLDPREAVAVAVYVAQALQYAWNKARLVHRDIKPDNIFLSAAGEVKVGDLGLAKMVGAESVELTSSGMMVGSPHYISPEQARAVKDIDFRTDIYSLGCTLYHMLSGRTPYEGSDAVGIIMRHVNDPPPAIFKVWPQCPVPLALALGRMMAKERAARHPSYEALLADLLAVHDKLRSGSGPAPLSPPQPAVPTPPREMPSQPARAARPPGRKPALPMPALAGAAAALLALAGLALWAPWKGRPPSAEDAIPAPPAASGADAFAAEVAALPPEEQVARVAERLRTLNPGFDGREKHVVEAGVVREFEFTSTHVRDIAPVGALKGLRKLRCAAPPDHRSPLADLSPLRGLMLEELNCSHTSVRDFSPLEGMPLRVLYCWGARDADLSTLKSLPLATLSLDTSPISDISPLAGLPLTYLRLSDTAVSDLSPLKGMRLWLLWCHHTRVNDLSLLQGMPLSDLKVDTAPLADPRNLAVLRSLATLRTINKLPATEFWEAVDAGKAPDPDSGIVADIGKPPAEDPACKLPGPAYTNAVGAEMVFVQPGEFLLGCTREERARSAEFFGAEARPARIATGFWMARTETTLGQWKKFIDAAGYKSEIEARNLSVFAFDPVEMKWAGRKGVTWRNPGFGFELDDRHPVCCLTWNDAFAFCEWLTEKERAAGRLPAGYRIRLPAEAEWEYACRGGKAGTAFWWGDSAEEGKGRLNWNGSGDGYELIAPVDDYGAAGRNGFGLADMLGNVPEWCLDSWDPGEVHEQCHVDPKTPAKVLRGGDFQSQTSQTRCAFRAGPWATSIWSHYGFRACLGREISGFAQTAVSEPMPVITNWQDVMPSVRQQMDKKGAVQHEDGWAVATGGFTGAVRIFDQPLAAVALRGRFRGGCGIHLAVGGSPSGYYCCVLKREGGSLEVRRPFLDNGKDSLEIRKLGDLRCPPADEHEFLITRVGEVLSVWIDGAFAGSAQDGTAASGTARMYLDPGDAIRDLAFADLGAPAPSSADDGWQNAINLLVLIDPKKDAVAGEWVLQNGELAVGDAPFARLELPYEAPEEYDFRITFTRLEGMGGIAQILSRLGHPFGWCLGFEDNRTGAFGTINGIPGGTSSNPSRVQRDGWIENKRPYTMTVSVRSDGLKAFLDGQQIAQWKTDYQDMGNNWRLRNPKCIGVGSTCNQALIFHRIGVREVTGKGTFTRGATPSAASSGEWTTLPNGWRVGTPVNLGPGVNCATNEISPTVSGDGLTLLFFSTRAGSRNSAGIWTSTRTSTTAQWGDPRYLNDDVVNALSLMRDPCLSSDGLTLIFSSTRRGGQGRDDLWISTRRGPAEPWGKAENLGPVINSEYSEGQQFLCADGLTLIFRSDRPGGQGGADIWMSTRPKVGEPWGAPLNLGPPVNSEWEDGRACIASDGLALFFASTRGGADVKREIWMSVRRSKAEAFDKPVNMGAVLNSRYEECSPWLSADDRTLYFNSDRPGGEGGHDLWMAPVQPPGPVARSEGPDVR